MAMEDVRICASNGKHLVFRGELLAQAATDQVSGPHGERSFDLRVYRRDDSGLVPAIDFRSTYEGEKDVTIAEIVDHLHDVENFFYVFEPCEVLTDKVLATMPAEGRQRVTKSILKLYDPLANRVLLTVNKDSTQLMSPTPKKESGKRGWLGILGLR